LNTLIYMYYFTCWENGVLYKPTLLLTPEKEASTLHLNLPLLGFLHLMSVSPSTA
jgi:hypothetical protein